MNERDGGQSLADESKAAFEYKAAFNGRFSGVLRWPQFETLWQALHDRPQGWYVYAPDEAGPPDAPHSAPDMKAYLEQTQTYLRERCMNECCGAVYADSFDQPGFVKIYNPQLMGGCGMGKAPLPQWILSKIPPVSLLEPVEADERGLMSRLMG